MVYIYVIITGSTSTEGSNEQNWGIMLLNFTEILRENGIYFFINHNLTFTTEELYIFLIPTFYVEIGPRNELRSRWIMIREKKFHKSLRIKCIFYLR